MCTHHPHSTPHTTLQPTRPPTAQSQQSSTATASARSSASRSAHVRSPSTSTSASAASLLAAAAAASLLPPEPYLAAKKAASFAFSPALVASLFRPRPGPLRPPPRAPRPPVPRLPVGFGCCGGADGGSAKKTKPSARSWSSVPSRLPLPRQQLLLPPPRCASIAFKDCSGFLVVAQRAPKDEPLADRLLDAHFRALHALALQIGGRRRSGIYRRRGGRVVRVLAVVRGIVLVVERSLTWAPLRRVFAARRRV
mmetsp:Transcript_55592/g.145886  ORF Transcript_55592/g.145886 Transcript_55592/m.145886 type:complete len:253 (+) Transcript_55592:138-896(+)